MFKRSLLTLAAVLLPTLVGCDSLTDLDSADPGTSDVSATSPHDKLRHWGLVEVGSDATANKGDGEDADSVDFIVTFSHLVEDPEEGANTIFSGHGVKVRTYFRDSFTGVAVSVAAAAFPAVQSQLIQSSLVSFVEPDIAIRPILSPSNYVSLDAYDDTNEYDFFWHGDQLRPWNVDRVGAHNSSAEAGNGRGSVDVDVYVIDGPIDHTDINVVERVNLLPRSMASDAPFHGTHVAGIIGALDDADGIVGVAPGARIHSLEVLNAEGATTLSTLLSAFEVVIARKMKRPDRPLVVSMSIGADLGTTELNALDEAVVRATEMGIVVVVSAGNGASDASTVSPAHAPGAITVGATDAYDTFAAAFSNYGSVVDLFAPGKDILSTVDGERYAVLSGTSMAAPHVAGAAALLLSHRPDGTPAQVLSALLAEARPVHGAPEGTASARLRVANF